MRRRENLWRGVHFLSWMKHARKASERVFFWRFSSENLLVLSSFHSGKLWQQLRFTGRSEAIAFLEIIRLVQDERSKCLHIVLVYGSTAVIKTTTLCWNEIALRFDEVYWSIKGQDQDWKVTNLTEVLSLILRRTLNEIVSVFWSSRKLFSAFLLRLFALVVHLQVFLIKHFASILLVLRSWVNYGILCRYLCGFRECTVDYFLYKLINLAKFAIFLMELSLPAGKFLNWAALAALVSHIRSNAGIMADNRDLVNQSES